MITLALFSVVGTAVALLLRIPLPPSIAARIAFVFLLGAGAHGAILFVLAAPGVRMNLWTFLAVPLLALVSFGVRRQRLRFSILPCHFESGSVASALQKIVFALPIAVLLFAAAVLPIRDYDGRVTWLPKARAIAIEQSTTGPFFQGERGLNLHNRYPLLLPLDAATTMVLSGDTRNEAARWLYVLIPIALFVVLRVMLSSAWIAAAMPWLGVLTAIEGGALAAYNDFALAAFLGMAVLYLLASLDQPAALRAVGLFAAFAVLTKNEGAMLALAILAAAVFVRRLKSIGEWLWMLVPVAAAEGIVVYWRTLVPAAYDEQYEVLVSSLPASLDRVPAAMLAILRHAADVSEWGGFWIAVAVAIVAVAVLDRSRRYVILLVTMALALAAYVVALSVTSWRIEDLAAVAVNRLLVHLLVPAACMLAMALRKTEPSAGVTPGP
ncbi:MAG TPA: hypothetical protein VGQ36_06445 [Thermoanaerobaculia bacterium]|nr:hypothetical protein [Thermoanaerobaculia bacterium]